MLIIFTYNSIPVIFVSCGQLGLRYFNFLNPLFDLNCHATPSSMSRHSSSTWIINSVDSLFLCCQLVYPPPPQCWPPLCINSQWLFLFALTFAGQHNFLYLSSLLYLMYSLKILWHSQFYPTLSPQCCFCERALHILHYNLYALEFLRHKIIYYFFKNDISR